MPHPLAQIVASARARPARREEARAEAQHRAQQALERARRRGRATSYFQAPLWALCALCGLLVLYALCMRAVAERRTCSRAGRDAAKPCVLLTLSSQWAALPLHRFSLDFELSDGRLRMESMRFGWLGQFGLAPLPGDSSVFVGQAPTLLGDVLAGLLEHKGLFARLSSGGVVLAEGGEGALRGMMPLLYEALGGDQHEVLFLRLLLANDTQPAAPRGRGPRHEWGGRYSE